MMGLRVYSIESKRLLTSAPAVGERDYVGEKVDDLTTANSFGYDVDQRITQLQTITIQDNPVNRHYAIRYEPVSQSFMVMTGRNITGKNLVITSKRDNVKKVLKTFNSDINVRHQTIEDWVTETWCDNVVHNSSVWRIAIYQDRPVKVDLQRIDQRTLIFDFDRLSGYSRWIQRVTLYPGQTYPNKEQFYKSDIGIQGHYWIASNLIEASSARYICLPNEANTIVAVSLFQQPPVVAAMPMLLYKIWIVYFMRKYAEKHWAPPLIGYVGDFKNNYFPYSSVELQKEINNMAIDLGKLRNFSSMGTAGYNRIEAVKLDTAKSAEVYVTYLKHLNEEIMYSLFGSMGQRTSVGNYVASSNVLDENWVRFVETIRQDFEKTLKRFYLASLLPLNGILDATDEDIEFIWPPTQSMTFKEMADSIATLVKVGVFNDQEECRRVASRVFPELEGIAANEKGYVPKIITAAQEISAEATAQRAQSNNSTTSSSK